MGCAFLFDIHADHTESVCNDRCGGPDIQDRNACDCFFLNACCGEIYTPSPVDVSHQLVCCDILFCLATVCIAAVEPDYRQFRLSQNLDLRHLSQGMINMLRKVKLFVERLTKCRNPVEVKRQPHPQSTVGPGELRACFAEVRQVHIVRIVTLQIAEI